MLLRNLLSPGVCLAFSATVACLARAEATSSEFALLRAVDRQRDFNLTPIQALHGEAIVEYGTSVWDIDTGEFLAGSNSGNSEELLHFDPQSQRSVYLTENGAIEARDDSQETLATLDVYAPYYFEAGLAPGGETVVARGTDAETYKAMLEARAVSDGSLLWKRQRPDHAEWIFLSDAGAILELKRAQSNAAYQAATLFDMATQTIQAELDISALEIRNADIGAPRGTDRVKVFTGDQGVLVVNGARGKLFAVLDYFADGHLGNVTVDSQSTRIVLRTKEFRRPTGEPSRQSFACFDAVDGTIIATSEDLTSAEASTGGPWAPAFSIDGAELYIVAALGRVEVWDLASKTLRRVYTYSNIPFTDLIPSADGRSVLAAAIDPLADDIVALLQAGKEGFRYQKVAFNAVERGPGFTLGYSTALLASPGRSRFYIESPRGAEAFDFETGAPIEMKPKLLGRPIAITHVSQLARWMIVYDSGSVEICQSPVGPAEERYRLETGYNLSIASIDPSSGAIAYVHFGASYLERPAGAPLSVELPAAPSGSEAFTFFDEGALVHVAYRGVYDVETGDQVMATPTLYRPVAADPASSRFAQETVDDSVAVYDAATGALAAVSDASYANINFGAFSPDGTVLYFAATPVAWQNYRLYAMDAQSGETIGSWDLGSPESSEFDYISLSAGGRFAYLGGARGRLALVDLNTGIQSAPRQFGPSPAAISEFKLRRLSNASPDGQICYIGRDGARYLIEGAAGRYIPATLSLTSDQTIRVDFASEADREYWIQASANLSDWSPYQSAETATEWINQQLQSKLPAFMRVIEVEGDPQTAH